MKASIIARKAARKISKRGWTRRTLRNAGGAYCIVGAIGDGSYDSVHRRKAPTRVVRKALEVLGENHEGVDPSQAMWRLINWNDNLVPYSTTDALVIATLAEAADLLEAEGD